MIETAEIRWLSVGEFEYNRAEHLYSRQELEEDYSQDFIDKLKSLVLL